MKFKNDVEVQNSEIKISSTASAHLILNGDTTNIGDLGEEDAIVDFLHDNGVYGYRLNSENWSQKSAFNIQENRSGTYTSRLYIDRDGQVGIGIEEPLVQATLHVRAANNVTGSIEIEGGKTTVTAIGEINSELNFGSRDASATGGIGGSIKSVTESTNGSTVGLAFYTADQQRTGEVLKEHMRITKAGNVGIGMDNPTARLNLKSEGTNKYVLRATRSSSSSDLFGFYEDGGGNCELYLRDSASTAKILINGNGDSYFNGGDVGIGTTNPSEKLEVSGSNTLSIKLSRNNTDATYVTTLTNNFSSALGTELKSGTYNILTHGNSTGTALNFTNGAMTFAYRSSTEYMRISNAGNVGIGTGTPTVKLVVADGLKASSGTLGQNSTLDIYGVAATSRTDNATVDMLRLHRAVTGDNKGSTFAVGLSYYSDPGSNLPRTRVDFKTTNPTADSSSATKTIMSLVDGGKVGIGTTNPLEELHVSSGSGANGDCVLLIEADTDNTVETSNPVLRLRQDGGSVTGALSLTSNNDMTLYNEYGFGKLFLGVGTSTMMTIDPNGKVGIGTTTPDSLLNLEGAKNTSIITLGSTTNNASWSVGDKIGAIDFYSGDGSGAGSGVKASISYEVEAGTTGSTNSMVFRTAGTISGTNNTERMRIESSGITRFSTTPIVLTRNSGDNTTYAASTAYVDNAVVNLGGIVDNSNATVATSQVGWVTVALANTARRAGEIYVTDGESGDHSFIRISWMRSYADSNFTVLNCGGHQNRIQGVRVLQVTTDPVYGYKYLQVLVTATSNYYVAISAPGLIPNYSNFTAVTPVLENTKAGYSVTGSQLEDLQNSSVGTDEGITVGEELYVNGTGNSYFTGNVGIGYDNPQSKLQVSSGNISETTLMVGASGTISDVSSRILLNEGESTFTDSKDYGFSLAYNGSGLSYGLASNEFAIIRHNNSATGVPVLTMSRGNNNAEFAGTVEATNFQLSSDKRLKNNIKEIDTKHIGVNWKNFELKSEPGVKRSGVIAQELEKKHPEFVKTNDKGMKSVAYIDLLIAKIAELEARLEKAGI